ncbi:cell division ATP-binding protein FtsE [bacterium DOLZORAL124_38_8]|nr:MAG: cell division ATP-binding protein FtsE [bacterium DOLZORAL124_38_8]
MLKFDSVSFVVQGKKILDTLSFEVLPQEVVAILGPSGAGKSTIFRLLTAERKPTEGAIFLDALAINDLSWLSVQEYRRQIGVVYQDFKLLAHKTVYQNVAYALEVCGEESLIDKVVPNVLKRVGLWDLRAAFPENLSGGESQRVAIARALVHNPKILIADEATGNLDPKNSREIAELFRYLNQEIGLTILFSTHDPVLVENLSPRVIRIDDGKISFDQKNCDRATAFAGMI